MSDGYETEELTRIEAALDALVSPTSEDVFQATRPFDERAIASVAAKRSSGGGGGGGASPVQVVGPFPVTYTDLTAFNVTSGFVVTSFAAGTIVLDVWGVPVTPWDNSDMRPQLSLYNGALYINELVLYNSPPQLVIVIDPDVPCDVVHNGNGWDVVQNQAFNSGDGLIVPARIRAGGCNLVAYCDTKTGTPTQGQFDMYALLYVPA